MAEIDNYLPCEQYTAANDSAKYPGFKAWFDEATGAWYFAAVTNRGRVVLRSEAYTSEPGRDNGIESVMRNRDIEERYSVAQGDDGHWYIILKAGNRQEIARSCAFDSEDAAKAGIAMCFSTAVDTAGGIVEDYLPCEAYDGHAAAEKYPGFTTFSADGQHFFAMVDGAGNVMLRSEAYKSEASRNNGIESVMKNRDLEERYAVVQDEADGHWYISLKAGNRQEIARSCGFESEDSAKAILARSFAQPASTGIVEDYLPCEAYAGKDKSEKHPGFTTFTNPDNGQHYFAMVDGHGGVILRSEAYTTAASRDNGIESVLKNRDNEERYSVVQDEGDGQWYVSLKAGNHQEIARSCGHPDRAAAEGHLLHCYSREALEKIATGEGQIIEDYLPCKAYEGHPASEQFEGFTIFQDPKSKLHYFAMIDDDGKVGLKSEGYKDPKRRDNGIESVIRNRGIKDHWREIEDEHGHYMSLRAVNHQEIARSCHKDKAAMLAWFAPFLAAHAGWGKDAEPEAPVVATPPPAKVVVNTEKAAPVTSYTEAAPPIATTGGNDWWKWLLGLLLLGLLAWLFMRGCGGCNNTPEAKPAVTTAPTPAPTPVDTAKTAAKPAPAPAPAATCNCNDQTDPVFKLGTGTPKSLSRLGTNPEFGNSHALSPTQFYEKLATRSKDNAVDKRFLDRMFKAMGYKNGFADAKPEMFSAVELAAGTVGNIGYSKQHKTLYARLDTQPNDLKAFRIKAANGCDLHFMKTCGNHMFFCGK
jgi:uncharacterized protein YegP (UPF0339 family)